jgi:DNA-binding NtrC family response regulator
MRILAEHFLRRFAEDNNKPLMGFSAEALEFITAYRWPGNVRELKNAIERAVILARGDEVSLADMRGYELISSEDREVRIPVGTPLEQVERTLVLKTFSFAEGDHGRAARLLGIEVDELRNRLTRAVASEAVPA